MSIDWIKEQPRLPHVALRRIADARVMEFASDQPIQVACDRSPVVDEPTCNLVLQLSGAGRCRQSGREVDWEAGDLLLVDNAQAFDVAHPAEFHLAMWQLSRNTLSLMLSDPDSAFGVRIPGDRGVGAVLGSFTRSLMRELPQCGFVHQQGLLTHLNSLIGLALGGSELANHSRRGARQAAQRQIILAYVETHLRNPRLSPARAAHDLRISQRWLHAVLEEGEMSFSQWVAHRRLEECKRMLDDPNCDELPIADIAFQWGFNDLSTFNRCFRTKYAMSPREVRRQRTD